MIDSVILYDHCVLYTVIVFFKETSNKILQFGRFIKQGSNRKCRFRVTAGKVINGKNAQ
jgi:hypothetical protein